VVAETPKLRRLHIFIRAAAADGDDSSAAAAARLASDLEDLRCWSAAANWDLDLAAKVKKSNRRQ